MQEILSFICVAESDAQQGIAPGELNDGRLDWDAYERLVDVVKHDLDSLEYNIYHTWMLEVKRKLAKLIIPALIESQSLPGFVTTDGSGRMFSRMLGGMTSQNQPSYTMDDILNLLNKVWKCLKSYYMEESVMQQVVTELLKLIGQIAFNDLIMRRNFCSWKRGEFPCAMVDLILMEAMQIQYNITRIEGGSAIGYDRVDADGRMVQIPRHAGRLIATGASDASDQAVAIEKGKSSFDPVYRPDDRQPWVISRYCSTSAGSCHLRRSRNSSLNTTMQITKRQSLRIFSRRSQPGSSRMTSRTICY